jgi:hypothetical protein
MREIVREVAQTVREVLQDWSRTARACVLLAAATAVWTCYHLLTK